MNTKGRAEKIDRLGTCAIDRETERGVLGICTEAHPVSPGKLKELWLENANKLQFKGGTQLFSIFSLQCEGSARCLS